MKKTFLFLLAISAFCMTGCNANYSTIVQERTDAIESITLNPNVLVLKPDETAFIDALIEGNATNPKITWKKGGEQSAFTMSEQVKHNGLPAVSIKADEIGEGTVTAIFGGQFSICTVKVQSQSEVVIPVTSVNVTPSNKTVYYTPGETSTFMLEAEVLPMNVTDKNVTWTSNNTDVATVSGAGSNAQVTIKNKGSATINATAGGKVGSCSLLVYEQGEIGDLKVAVNPTNATIELKETLKITADTNKPAALTWESNNPAVASVVDGIVTGNAVGTATISVKATADGEEDAASCLVTVQNSSQPSDYEKEIAKWSKKGHLYLHYLRDEADYDDWAVWMWQKLPKGLEGSLWGATKCPKDMIAMTTSWMKNSECGKSGDAIYSDKYGQVCDIDLNRNDIVDGKSGENSPIVPKIEGTNEWTNLKKARIGFLIVDQTKMNGGSHWTSDGGIEAYIKNLDEKFPQAQDSYLHIFCTQGSVAMFTTSSGQPVVPNPTADDQTGDYRSQNDISNLKFDAYPNGVKTSETFLEDRPGTGYQIFVPSFADADGDGMGDLRGIINKLDYLDELGVKTLWLSPIQESGSYHGYDVTDYYKIDPKFGTIEDYQELLYKAHQKGMKVLMDMVINHTSKNNVLYTKSQRAEVETVNGKIINYRDMYLWKFKGDYVTQWDGVVPADKDTPAKYESVPVEEASDWYQDGSSNYYYFGKFGSGMAELNYSSQVTRDYMTDMCKYWLSFGLDGFRLDAIKHIYLLSELEPGYNLGRDSITYDVGYKEAWDEEMKQVVRSKNDYSYDLDLNVVFWKQFAGSLKTAYPNCFLVGENFDGWNKRIAPFYESIDSQFDFSTYYHLNEMPIASITTDVKETLNYNKAYRKDHINGAFTSNHDIARLLNHAGANGAASHTTEVNESNKALANNRAKYFAAVTLLTPGLSWIYYGDEIGMSGNTEDVVPNSEGKVIDDHGNNKDRWYRQPMRWGDTQGQDQVPLYVFNGLEVNWDKYNRTIANVSSQRMDDNSMFTYFKTLCSIKNDKSYPTYGYVNWSGTVGNEDSASMQITDGTRTVNVFINASDKPLTINEADRGSRWLGGSLGSNQYTVPAYGFTVVVC
ncbi:MAG: alpha-amylase family glycosyl hydrolase [Bacilli bacterium]|nr:alpha-amylase family glycosyl hydrolase [Bacilli bacterium]